MVCVACDGSSVSRGEQTNGQVSAQPSGNSGPPLRPPAGLFTPGRQCPSPPHLNSTYFRRCDTGKVSATIVAASLLDRHQLFSWQWSRQMVSWGGKRVHLGHRLCFSGEKRLRGAGHVSAIWPSPAPHFVSPAGELACLSALWGTLKDGLQHPPNSGFPTSGFGIRGLHFESQLCLCLTWWPGARNFFCLHMLREILRLITQGCCESNGGQRHIFLLCKVKVFCNNNNNNECQAGLPAVVQEKPTTKSKVIIFQIKNI